MESEVHRGESLNGLADIYPFPRGNRGTAFEREAAEAETYR
jgi:hypothetical protein